jgi:hypothetical protein
VATRRAEKILIVYCFKNTVDFKNQIDQNKHTNNDEVHRRKVKRKEEAV